MKTRSEKLFESFLAANNIDFERIEETVNQKGARRPDYLAKLPQCPMMFEIKELTEDPKFGVVDSAHPQIRAFNGTPGNHVRTELTAQKSRYSLARIKAFLQHC